jgi:hypothetical protein
MQGFVEDYTGLPARSRFGEGRYDRHPWLRRCEKIKLLGKTLIRPQERVSWKNSRAVPFTVGLRSFNGNNAKGLLPRQVGLPMTLRDSEVLERDSF